MKLREIVEQYEPSEKDFGACALDEAEKERILGKAMEKISNTARPKRLKGKFALIAAAVALATVTTAFAAGMNLGLFERALGDGAEQYSENVNTVTGDGASVKLADAEISLKSTIFTDTDVYAILACDGEILTAGDLAVSGRIRYADADQTAYGLKGRLKAIDPEDGDEGVQYFLYSATIAPTQISGNKELVMAAGDQFLKYSSLRDCEGEKLELTVAAGGEEGVLLSTVEKVSTEALSFHPDVSAMDGDFYDTVLITPYQVQLSGVSKKSAAELEKAGELPVYSRDYNWYTPDITLVVSLKDGSKITLVSKMTADEESVSDVRFVLFGDFPDGEYHYLGCSAGGDPETGEFYNNMDFRFWELDLAQIASVTINGEVYKVGK